VASGKASRRPVKVGAHADIERQLGAPPLRQSETPDDDFGLPPGYKNPYQEHREAQANERRVQRDSATRPPSSKSRAAGARRPSSRSGRSGSRSRPSSPSLTNPTGGRLPIGFDGEGIAGAFFGMVLYALGVSVADYGVSGPLYWFKAKFMNIPAPAKATTK
jgi:hypothetical protein